MARPPDDPSLAVPVRHVTVSPLDIPPQYRYEIYTPNTLPLGENDIPQKLNGSLEPFVVVLRLQDPSLLGMDSTLPFWLLARVIPEAVRVDGHILSFSGCCQLLKRLDRRQGEIIHLVSRPPLPCVCSGVMRLVKEHPGISLGVGTIAFNREELDVAA